MIDKIISPLYGDVKIFLHDLAGSSPEDYRDGYLVFYGEDEQGKEGSADIEIGTLASEAAKVIERLQEREALLEKISRRRISLIPEYEGGWRAEAYEDACSPVKTAYGMTVAEAVSKID